MTDSRRRDQRALPAGAAAYWSRLERMLETPELRARLERDHPGGAAELAEALSRRSFVKLMGASLALAGLDACTRMPAERILPYVKQPPELAPGVPQYYATSMVVDGFATGLVVETHEGRPTKIEGNPDHPASLGAAGVLEQASVLQLYDPDRARYARQARKRASWQSFMAAMSPAVLRNRVGTRGAGLRLLLEPTSSAVESDLLQRIRGLYPEAGIHFYSPLRSDVGADASLGAGAAVLPIYDFHKADVVLVVDDDPLASGPFRLRYARDFADRRRVPSANMNRLYVVESAFTVTGAAADHRLRARPSAIEPVLAHLSSLLASSGGSMGAGSAPGLSPAETAWLVSVARDLKAHTGRALVVVGERQSPRARALGRAINQALAADGATVHWVASPLIGAGDASHGLAHLLDALRAKSVDTLVISGVNLAYAAPGDIGISGLLAGARNRVYHGLYDDETAQGAEWVIPAAHYLESWGDARAYDGTLSVVQPVLQPLYESRTRTELLGAIAGVQQPSALALLRQAWNGRRAGIAATGTASAGGSAATAAAGEDEGWRDFLRRGFVPGSASAVGSAGPPPPFAAGGVTAPPSAGEGQIELVFLPDARILDGRFANNGWLQELPDPVTKLTWENAAQLSPATAQRLGVATGDMVTLRANGATARLPAIVVPGLADETAVVQFGYGRTGAESVASGAGADVYPLWRSGNFVTVATLAKTPGHRELPITQDHWSMQGRDPARVMSVPEYERLPASPARRRALTLYEPQSPQGVSPHQWAMTIDLGACIGCGACVVGCQAENNIPVVGSDGVVARREMHWIRVDRYIEPGTQEADPRVVTEPMLCQHCEKAPCEYVCPVEATEHSSDGLNEMIYNRCVGTRFCSNNCPYKVRRFNWFDYNAHLSELELMVKNPDVTVRERGVMEKCSFCVQRIREAEIAAGREGRPLRGSEVQTACQQACPTRAIAFGSLTEPDSEVVRQREDRRAFTVLESLGTEPRVRYLARVRNPNPELERNA